MFLERELIQSVGFANVREGDEVTGFRLHLRMPSYRGLAASLIDGVSVRVDDVVDVGHDTPLWRFDGRDIGIDELRRSDGLRWQLEEPGVVTVPHPAVSPPASTRSRWSCSSAPPTSRSSTSRRGTAAPGR